MTFQTQGGFAKALNTFPCLLSNVLVSKGRGDRALAIASPHWTPLRGQKPVPYRLWHSVCWPQSTRSHSPVGKTCAFEPRGPGKTWLQRLKSRSRKSLDGEEFYNFFNIAIEKNTAIPNIIKMASHKITSEIVQMDLHCLREEGALFRCMSLLQWAACWTHSLNQLYI